MGRYAIGDLQGCYLELLDLLDAINFDEGKDRLLFAGDLVNRGPDSLKALQFVKQLGDSALTVLGNHDLHLLAIANGQEKYMHAGDTFTDVLNASDKDELLSWLRQQPMLHRDSELDFTLVHAGVAPQWQLSQAVDYAQEVESCLRSDNFHEYFAHMYGNQPAQWSEKLRGWKRLRVITNYLTRLRFCDEQGHMVFKEKGIPGSQPSTALPWFELGGRKSRNDKIIFGHWAALRDYEQDYKRLKVYPIDMGCVWGGNLVALRLEDEKIFSVPSRQQNQFS